MRIILLVLLVVAALLGVTPYFIGSKIESAAQGHVQELQMPGYSYSLEVERGYRSSRLSYRLEMDPDFFATYYALGDDQSDQLIEALSQFEIELQVEHGPLLTTNGLGFGLADLELDLVRQTAELEALSAADEDPLVSAQGRIDFFGDGLVQYQMPPTNYLDPQSGIASYFSGLEGELSFEDYGTSLTASAVSEGGMLSMADELSIEFGKLELAAQMVMEPDFSWILSNSGDVILDTLSIQADNFAGQLHQLNLGFDVRDGATPESSTIEYRLVFDELAYDELIIEEGALSLAYENLSKATLRNYMELASNLPLNDAQAVDAALLQFALGEFPEMLSHGPAIALPRLAFSYEGRTFEANMRTSVDAGNLPAMVSPLRVDLLIPALKAEFYLDTDESLLNEILAWQATSSVDASLGANPDFEVTPEMRQTMIDQQASMSLGMAVAQGFLLRENGRIQADLKLANRMLDINGNAMPLPF